MKKKIQKFFKAPFKVWLARLILTSPLWISLIAAPLVTLFATLLVGGIMGLFAVIVWCGTTLVDWEVEQKHGKSKDR